MSIGLANGFIRAGLPDLPDYVIQAGESFGWSVHNSILILFKAFYIAYLPE